MSQDQVGWYPSHWVLAVFVWGVLLGWNLPAYASIEENYLRDVPDIRVDAFSYVLMEQSTGTVVKSHNRGERVQPASLTKLMTAYILAQNIAKGAVRLDQETTISKNAWRISGSTMFLEAGDEVTVEQLFLGLVVHSGNDAAIAIAELIAGDVEAFVDRMNQEAQRLGMTQTQYRNPNGLPDDQQYTTAQDTAKLARALITDYQDLYQRFYAVKTFTYADITQHNRNRLLWSDEGFDGIKTGHVESAGYHIVVSAKREGMRFIGVLMGTKSEKMRTAQARKLIDWAFRHFKIYPLYQAFAELGQTRVWMGKEKMLEVGIAQPLNMVLTRQASQRIGASLVLVQYKRAPIAVGEPMGELVVRLGNEELRRINLIALTDIPLGGLLERIIDWFKLQLLKFNA